MTNAPAIFKESINATRVLIHILLSGESGISDSGQGWASPGLAPWILC